MIRRSYYLWVLCPMVTLVLCIAPQAFPGSISHTVTFNLNEFTFRQDNGFDIIEHDKCYFYGEAGAPQVPIYSCNFIIPCSEAIQSISINSATAVQFQGTYNMLPRQNSNYYINHSDTTSPDWVYPDPKYYDSDDPYPSDTVLPGREGYFDGANNIATILILPIYYKPLSKELYYFSSITFTLTTGGTPAETPIWVSSRMRDDQIVYDEILAASVVNPQDISLYGYTPPLSDTSISQDLPYPLAPFLIITRDSLIGYWDSYVDWLNRKGKRAKVVSIESIVGIEMVDDAEIDDDADLLRGYLKYVYERGVVWVLLGGTCEITIHPDIYTNHVNVPLRYLIPIYYRNGMDNFCREGTSDVIATDNYFSDLQPDWEIDGDGYPGEAAAINFENPALGGDGFALSNTCDLFVGRLPVVDGQDIINWTQKILNYEQNPGNGSYDYLFATYWNSADGFQMGNHYQAAHNASRFPISPFTHFYSDEEPRYDSSPPNAPHAQTIISDMSSMSGFINFHHHGGTDRGYVMTWGDGVPMNALSAIKGDNVAGCTLGDAYCHMTDLTNQDCPGFLYSVACEQAAFDCGFEPLGELRHCMGASYVLGVNGGTAFMGTSRYGIVHYSFLAKEYFLDYVFSNSPDFSPDHRNRIAPAKSYMDMNYPDSYRLTILNNWMLLGSPEQEIWTDWPSHFTVVTDYPNNRVTVSVGGSPVEGALVCFMSRVSSAYYVATTNANGVAQVDPDYPLDVTEATDITITKHNFIPYQIIGSGDIDNNIYWRGDIAFYGNINIPSGKTLTIKPGAIVKTAGTELSVRGTLKIEGTSDQYAVFTSVNTTPAKGDWTGIRVYSGGSLNMSYCDIQYATTGIRADQPTAFAVDHCLIDSNSTAGIYVDASGATGLAGEISHSRIQNSGNYGLYWKANTFSAIYDTIYNTSYGIYYLGNSSPNIEDCVVTRTAGTQGSYYGIYMSKISTAIGPLIKNDSICGFSQGGI